MLKWFGCGRCGCRVGFVSLVFVLPVLDCLFLGWLVFLSGGVASSYPSPATCASPVDGTAIRWDTQRNTSFSRVLRDEDLLFSRICGVEGFGAVIESTSVPSGRINNPLSLVMDVSLSCSARIPGARGRLFQPALSDTDQG